MKKLFSSLFALLLVIAFLLPNTVLAATTDQQVSQKKPKSTWQTWDGYTLTVWTGDFGSPVFYRGPKEGYHDECTRDSMEGTYTPGLLGTGSSTPARL